MYYHPKYFNTRRYRNESESERALDDDAVVPCQIDTIYETIRIRIHYMFATDDD